MKSMDKSNDETLKALLPLFVSGRLSGDDRVRVQAWLDATDSARAELAWWQAVQRDLRAKVDQDLVEYSGDFGMARFQERLAGIEPGSSVKVVRRLDQWREWWRAHWMAPALGLCAAMILVQAVLLHQSQRAQPDSAMEPLSGALPASSVLASSEAVFLVAFEPGATEANIRELLAKVQGEIVGGPTALGLYRVRCKGELEQVFEQLKQAQGIVSGVSRAD